MVKFIRSTQAARKAVVGFVSRHVPKIGVAASALAASGAASAQDGLGATALAQITTLNADVKAILVILVGVVFLFVLYSFIKRAK